MPCIPTMESTEISSLLVSRETKTNSCVSSSKPMLNLDFCHSSIHVYFGTSIQKIDSMFDSLDFHAEL